MTIKTLYFGETDRFEHRIHDRMVAEDIAQALRDLAAHEAWGDGKPRIIQIDPDTDISDLTLDAIKAHVAKVLNDHAEKFANRTKTAFVVTGLGHDIIMRLFQFAPGTSDKFTYGIFDNRDDAVAWLED